jgi:hypothetical protein
MIGTPIENISFDNCYMDCLLPIFISSNYIGINDEPAPRIRNISFSNLTVRGKHNIVVQASPHTVVENITFCNVDFDCVEGAKGLIDKYGCGEGEYATVDAAFYTAHAKRLTLRDVRVCIEEGSPIQRGIVSYGTRLTAENVSVEKCGTEMPLIEERAF